jgi:hypothetical protein
MASKYQLKEGVVIYPFGEQCQAISNENITDEIAEYLIESKKAKKEDFVIAKSTAQ